MGSISEREVGVPGTCGRPQHQAGDAGMPCSYLVLT